MISMEDAHILSRYCASTPADRNSALLNGSDSHAGSCYRLERYTHTHQRLIRYCVHVCYADIPAFSRLPKLFGQMRFFGDFYFQHGKNKCHWCSNSTTGCSIAAALKPVCVFVGDALSFGCQLLDIWIIEKHFSFHHFSVSACPRLNLIFRKYILALLDEDFLLVYSKVAARTQTRLNRA